MGNENYLCGLRHASRKQLFEHFFFVSVSYSSSSSWLWKNEGKYKPKFRTVLSVCEVSTSRPLRIRTAYNSAFSKQFQSIIIDYEKKMTLTIEIILCYVRAYRACICSSTRVVKCYLSFMISGRRFYMFDKRVCLVTQH